MSWRRWLLGAGGVGSMVLLATAVAAPAARADLVVPGTRQLAKSEARLELGKYADYCEHAHVVAPGDTLDAIARAAYGDAARVADLLAANPGVVAEALKVKSALLLPPKSAEPADGAEPLAWQVWWGYGHAALDQLRRLRPGEPFGPFNRPITLVALPTRRAADFEKLRSDDPKRRLDGTWEASVPWLACSGVVSVLRAVPNDSPVHSARTTVALERIGSPTAGEPTHRLAVVRQTFDRDGQPLATGAAEARGGPGDRRTWLLLPALLGAMAVAWRALQLRRLSGSSAHTA